MAQKAAQQMDRHREVSLPSLVVQALPTRPANRPINQSHSITYKYIATIMTTCQEKIALYDFIMCNIYARHKLSKANTFWVIPQCFSVIIAHQRQVNSLATVWLLLVTRDVGNQQANLGLLMTYMQTQTMQPIHGGCLNIMSLLKE